MLPAAFSVPAILEIVSVLRQASETVRTNRARLVRLFAWAAFVFAAFSVSAYALPEIVAYGRMHAEIGSVPKRSVALVFGTSQYAPSGGPNAFFWGRIVAASELYKSGKVDCLLVSGDNSSADYNEARSMQLALMDEGVPPERIILDYAGFRTLDSVYRAKLVFGQSEFTVVTQGFQAERAIFLASGIGADVVAYVAPDVPFESAPGTYFREVPARVAALFDLAIAGTGPKFLGESIRIETDPTVRPVPDKVCFPR